MAELCDLFNAAGGWLRGYGWAGERRLVRGRDQAAEFDLFPDVVAILNFDRLPGDWRAAFDDSDWNGEGGTFPLTDLLNVCRSLGWEVEPLCATTFLVLANEIPF